MKEQRAIVDGLLDECDRQASLYSGKDIEYAQKALELSKSIKYDIGIYESHFRIARSLMSGGNNEEAIEHLNICYSVAHSLGDKVRSARAANSFGIAYYNLGIVSKSLDYLLEALEISETNDYRDVECRVYNNICSILNELGDYETAIEYLYTLLGKCGDKEQSIFPICIVYRNLAHTLHSMGRIDEAEKFVNLALEESLRQENFQIMCESYYILGKIRLSQNKVQAARHFFLKALALAEETSNDYYLAQIRIDLGKLYCSNKFYEEAYNTILEAYNFVMKHDYPILKRNAALTLAEICQYTNNNDMLIEALTTYKDITRMLEDENLHRQQVFAKAQLMLFKLKKDNERLRVEIERDPLTGCLSNRTFPGRIIQSLSVHGNKGAMVFIDIDNLKTINDTYGHDCGDELLKSFARDLTRIMPKESLKIRISGDEFLAFIPKAGKEEASAALDRLIEALAQPRKIGNEMLPVLISAGIALYPEHSTDIINLKKMADAAMYSAKQAGRGVYRIFNAS